VDGGVGGQEYARCGGNERESGFHARGEQGPPSPVRLSGDEAGVAKAHPHHKERRSDGFYDRAGHISVRQTEPREGGYDKVKRAAVAVICFVLIVLSLSIAGVVHGEDYSKFPERPITFICAPPPGSTGDLVARFMGRAAEKYFKQPVVIVNKPGAGTTIGVASIAKAKPDGYTVGYTPPTALFTLPFMERLPYHPLKDFQQIIQYTDAPFGVVVAGDSPFKTFKDLIEFARKNPKKLSYGTQGTYGIADLTVRQIAKKEGGLQFNQIGFKGGTEQAAAIMGGHIDFSVGDFSYPLVEAGKIRLLALLGEKRNEAYPGVPSLKELGYDRPDVPPIQVFINIAGPKGIPEEVVEKLEQGFTQAAKDPILLNGLKELRWTPDYRNSKEMTEYVKNYYEFYGQLLKTMGLRKY
jgi:tripartite-type tricarboxylate transporter receptor subunit TctC